MLALNTMRPHLYISSPSGKVQSTGKLPPAARLNGFSDLAIPTLQIGRKANLIAMSGQDLILILERHWTLHDALRAKLRHTGETAEAYKPLTELKN